MMKKVFALLGFICMFSIAAWREITFFPATGEMTQWCLVATDIVIDTENIDVAATDIVIESSLDFVDFVPSDMFPYFLPPKVMSWLVHIVWFTLDNNNRVNGKWSIGTLYMKQKNPTDKNGSVKLYFKKKWDTIDSNLSIAGGIDVLDTVWSAYYTFVNSGACLHGSAEDIAWWIANKTLDQMLAPLKWKQRIQHIFTWTSLLEFSGLLLILILLFVYYKTTKQWKNK